MLNGVRMFRYIRFCVSCMVAGLIGMFAGTVGRVYIFEFSDRSDVLLQAASVFSDLDELSFLVSLGSVLLLVFLCLAVEWKRWQRKREKKRLDSLN